MLRISKLRISHINRLTVNLIRPTSIIPKHRNRLRDILAEHNIERLAVVPGIDGGQNVLVALAQVSQLPEESAALLGRQVSPFRAGLESRSCCCDGGVDVLLACGLDFGDDGFVERVDCFDGLAGGGGDEFVVDEETCLC